MGKNSVRRKREMQATSSEGVTNMRAISEYRPRSTRKASAISFDQECSPRNPRQAEFISSILRERVTIGIGSAGTGKTHIAVSVALKLVGSGQYDKIYIARPAVEAEGENLGHLPGTADEKLYPYLIPIFDILNELLGCSVVENIRRRGVVEIVPLAYLRGRTLKDAVVILDEMQNATLGQFKMALTRLGSNSKCIITGDPDPSQNDRKGKSGLAEATAKLEAAPGFGVVRFRPEDVVRDDIVKVVLEYLN